MNIKDNARINEKKPKGGRIRKKKRENQQRQDDETKMEKKNSVGSKKINLNPFGLRVGNTSCTAEPTKVFSAVRCTAIKGSSKDAF